LDLKNHLYSFPILKEYEENDIKWDIDHIFPIKAFLDYSIDDPKIINSLDNLQPLEHIENIKKSGYYNKEDFENYLKSKGIILNEK
jgi:hypothetical protein